MRILNKALVFVSKARFQNQPSYAIARPCAAHSVFSARDSIRGCGLDPGNGKEWRRGGGPPARPVGSANIGRKGEHARKPVAHVHTDARGTFRFGSVLPGHYGLEIFKAGFKRSEQGFTVSGGAGRPVLASLDAKPLELPSDLRAARSRAQ
jgi:hypothetical protein